MSLTARRRKGPEQLFQAGIIRIAKLTGWQAVYHTWNSMHSTAGYPDLHLAKIVIVDGNVVVARELYAELKGPRGKLSPHQYRWLDILTLAGNECYYWKQDGENSQPIADVLQAESDPGLDAYGRWQAPDLALLNPVSLYRWEFVGDAGW